jgi:hypothetical protein
MVHGSAVTFADGGSGIIENMLRAITKIVTSLGLVNANLISSES